MDSTPLHNAYQFNLPALPLLSTQVELAYVLRPGTEDGRHWHDFRLLEKAGISIIAALDVHYISERLELNRVWVASAYRRQGIGSFMLEVARSVAAHMAYGPLFATLEPFDGPSIDELEQFYQRHGFILADHQDQNDPLYISMWPSKPKT